MVANMLFFNSMWIYTIILIVYVITVFGIVGVVISENRNPVKSLAWVTVLLLVPIIGMVLYAFFGRSFKSKRMISRKNKRKLRRSEVFKQIDSGELNLSRESIQQIRLAHSLSGAEYFPGNKIEIFTNGKSKFSAFKRDLLNATEYIHMQYYIFEEGEIGNEICEILKQKAKEGVKVRVIYDHVGCFNVKKRFYNDMRNAGVDVQPFMKVTFPQFATRINWRNHRKITVIDGEIGYIGGMNIADRYIQGVSFGAWRDTHLRIIGPAVGGLQYSFAVDWNFMGKPLLIETTKRYNLLDNADAGIQVLTSGPLGQWSNISFLFLKAIANAKKSIYIQTPYFLPTESLLKTLQTAALSKVDVRIMIPRRSDSLILKLASFSYISECLKAGIKI
ncbi:MAG: cardiolipin synthase, partial [Muribaculaceae bacterium]